MWNNTRGEFERYQSTFRRRIRSDGSTSFTPEAGRYHLYISWACPWAHRTALVRSQTDINPTRIVPVGPVLDFGAPHGRGAMTGSRA